MRYYNRKVFVFLVKPVSTSGINATKLTRWATLKTVYDIPWNPLKPWLVVTGSVVIILQKVAGNTVDAWSLAPPEIYETLQKEINYPSTGVGFQPSKIWSLIYSNIPRFGRWFWALPKTSSRACCRSTSSKLSRPRWLMRYLPNKTCIRIQHLSNINSYETKQMASQQTLFGEHPDIYILISTWWFVRHFGCELPRSLGPRILESRTKPTHLSLDCWGTFQFHLLRKLCLSKDWGNKKPILWNTT